MVRMCSFVRFGGSLIAAVALLAAAPAAESSSPITDRDWPQWRGPHRDAVSPQQGLLKEWPAGGPEVLWRTPIGEGFSSISVSQGRLYTLWDEAAAQFLVSLDASTGEVLWRRRVDAAFANVWGNGPRSTPAVDHGIVYAVSARGMLYAVNALDGRSLWSHDLAKEYGARIPDYGYASSPLVEDDKLIVEAGGKENHAFMAFGKTTGEVVWASQTDAAAYSSPLAITVGGVRQIVFFSASGLFAVAPEDGSLLWKYGWESRCPSTGMVMNLAHPVFIAPDRIFISGGFGTRTGSAVIHIIADGGSSRSELIWRSEEMRNQLNSSVLYDEHIYGFDVGILQAVDARTGERKWQERGFQRGSLIEADGHLIVLGEEGRLALVEATPAGYREKASASMLDGKSWTMPTLADGRLFLRNQTEMVSLDLIGNRD